MLYMNDADDSIEPRDLLKQAAYFAHYALVYSRLRLRGPPSKAYAPFLSAALLQQYVNYPKS